MTKIIVTTILKPWFGGKPLEKGETFETDDADVVKHFTDHGFGVALEEPAAEPAAEPAPAPKKGKESAPAAAEILAKLSAGE